MQSTTSNYRRSIFHSLSLGVLLILPKCSLCIFAISNAIAVCGLQPLVNPFWEHLLVGFFLVIHASIMLFEMRNGRKWLPIIIALAGLVSVTGFLFFDFSQGFYYGGVLMLTTGWLLLRILNGRRCNAECSKNSDSITFSTIDKT